MSAKLETEAGTLLRWKLVSINVKANTDFVLEVVDDTGKQHDWLYCLKVGDRFVTDEWDAQEMFAFLCGMYHGILVGKAK